MQSKMVRMLALVLLLCGAGVALAQQQAKKVRVEEEEKTVDPRAKQKSPPEKSKLEEMLAEALKNNADIRVATAKLAEAEAELNRTRVQVTQQVATLHHAIVSQKATVEFEQKKYDRMRTLQARQAIDNTLVDEELAKLTAAKAKLAELEAQVPGLLGKVQMPAEAQAMRQPLLVDFGFDALAFTADGKLHYRTVDGMLGVINSTKMNIPQAEIFRKALQTPVKVDYKDMTFDAILDDLAKKAPGLSIRKVNMEPNYKISLRFAESLPISAILQAVGDQFGCSFYVREYGIVAAMPNSLPKGALKVEEFLRQKPAGESRNQSSSGKNPPQENVEGLVKNTDSSGLMTITIGSDAGLAKGHTLELFRLVTAPEETKYLGTIRIVEVDAHQAVAQPVGRLSAPAQPGDRVASRILGK